MKQLGIALVLATFAVSLAVPAMASPAEEGETHEFDALHHVADGYYLDFLPIGIVELPRIFLVRGEGGGLGLDVFGSSASALRSGAYEVEEAEVSVEERVVTGEVGHTDPSELSEASLEALIASHAHLDAHLVPVAGTLLLDLSITRHLVWALLGALLVLAVFLSMAGRYKRGVGRETAPRGIFQNLFETLVVFVRDDIAKPNLGDKYRRYLPFLLTAFFFILFSNLLGLVPFGATATSNLMVTAVLATFTFVLTQFNGSKDHWKHVLWPPGVPTFVKPILIPVEILGLFTKPIALAIRLFANMTAGHLVILSLIGLIFAFTNIFSPAAGYGVSPVSVVFALFIYLLELLVSFIQAYIFTMLSALFIGMAIAEHDHDHDPEHAVSHEGDLPSGPVNDHGHVTPHTFTDGIDGHVEPRPVAVPAAH